ncbi:hypothetical protein GSI_11905 [Ganoderma sinense ZZ0214-1]|uniref:Uncharacterized protein n=1 Tax=Ganoderma sinense ZZ0214-1 TaxID=1077348 RepID=A0A2G8RXA8_9APHY|nr:hypothetical protein GSI_11905 [Ganoderma sinense ZZ0214-1]
MRNDYRQTPFDELEWWFATLKRDKVLGSPEEAKIIQNTLGKQIMVLDSQNATENLTKLTKDPDWGAHLALAYHTVILRPGVQGRPGGLTQESFFRTVATTLPYMRNVKELILLGSDIDLGPDAATARDLFEGTEMPLETLWCDSKALLARCWASLCTSTAVTTLQDFRGFCDPHEDLPSEIAPPRTPKLKYLETSAQFAFKLQDGVPWGITHLCIHVEWHTLPLMLKKISDLQALSDRLHSLRLNCYASLGIEEQPTKGGSTPRAHRSPSPLAMRTPLLVCRNLRAPVLNYLEIKEITPCDDASLNALPNGLAPHNGTGTRSLRRIAWHPAWNKANGKQSGGEIRNAVDEIFRAVLTVNFLAVALDRHCSGLWRVFTRDLPSGRINEGDWGYAINELSWKVTEWEDAGAKRWHWPQSSQLYVKGLVTL